MAERNPIDKRVKTFTRKNEKELTERVVGFNKHSRMVIGPPAVAGFLGADSDSRVD